MPEQLTPAGTRLHVLLQALRDHDPITAGIRLRAIDGDIEAAIFPTSRDLELIGNEFRAGGEGWPVKRNWADLAKTTNKLDRRSFQSKETMP